PIAVAPWISCTRIFSPASNVSPSSSGRAVHVSPPSSTRPPPEPTASTTVPSRPVRAAVLVSFSGSADNRRLRARGRTPTSRITETSANARAWPHNGAPRNAAADPPSAPPASIRRTSSPPTASPAASSTAAPSHPSPICMPRHYRLRGTGCDVSYGLPACGRRRLSSSDVSTLLKFAWLSVATAVVTIGLKTWAWWMTGSVGLLSDAAESVVNLVAAVVRLGVEAWAWWMTGAVVLLSDAAEAVVNLVAAVVALIAITVAERPADADHQYGHAKAEYFSAVVEGAMIFLAAAVILYTGVERLINPAPLESLGLGMAISVVAAVLNGVVGALLVRAGIRHRSPTLKADGKHLLTDVITSVGVVVGV